MKAWNRFWKDRKEGRIDDSFFLGTDQEFDFKLDLERFGPYLDPDLPFLDLGCGDGHQTRLLARHYRRVIGADFSNEAIDLAMSRSKDGVEFVLFDARDIAAARRLHDTYGDLNIYMRGVMHMVKWQERPDVIRSLGILLGSTGTLYQIELSSDSILTLRSLPDKIFDAIPKVTRRVGFNLAEREKFYPEDEWLVLDEGDSVRLRSFLLEDGTEVSMPGNYLILRRRS